ncbi:hypothetical protein MON38_01475 [Hymenobacter sp. DH14]|uniref:Uncharacterized protein n=1 Tax=Hymenobacter cyanobacteriorum TaxID=2926463 RepID=A0A9X1VFS4_9BACT|nr:hypothetical protein [Hymenobacter cyanobacteriorum]MCI1186071.1 hypothetical protein [Hymenobacter cyanobacteriorum]
MLENLLNFLRPVRLYALLLLLPLAWFAWGTATGTRLLGDDNESTETLNAPGTGGHGHAGRGLYFHK